MAVASGRYATAYSAWGVLVGVLLLWQQPRGTRIAISLAALNAGGGLGAGLGAAVVMPRQLLWLVASRAVASGTALLATTWTLVTLVALVWITRVLGREVSGPWRALSRWYGFACIVGVAAAVVGGGSAWANGSASGSRARELAAMKVGSDFGLFVLSLHDGAGIQPSSAQVVAFRDREMSVVDVNW